jgi:hypothetical protein
MNKITNRIPVYLHVKKAQYIIQLALLSIGLFNPIVISAQDLTQQNQAAEVQDVESLRASFNEYTQNPANKRVKFEMVLKSNIDSDRVRITWTTQGPSIFEDQSGYTIDGNTARGNIAIRKGQTYTIPIEVTVAGEGINELFGKAEAFQAESTFVATVRKNYASNESGEVLPLTDAYNQAKTQNTILNIIVVVIAVVAILVAIYFALRQFLKWLDKDERDLNSK